MKKERLPILQTEILTQDDMEIDQFEDYINNELFRLRIEEDLEVKEIKVMDPGTVMLVYKEIVPEDIEREI